MNKNDNIYGESREQKNEMQNNSRTNANTNDLDSRSNSGDNSGMHAGGTAGSSYQRQQPENPSQYGSKTGSYWEEKGSDREHSAENRIRTNGSSYAGNAPGRNGTLAEGPPLPEKGNREGGGCDAPPGETRHPTCST